jgi:hypothetical protein
MTRTKSWTTGYSGKLHRIDNAQNNAKNSAEMPRSIAMSNPVPNRSRSGMHFVHPG